MAFQDSRHIWIGTDGGGLYDYDFLTKKFKRYTNQDALPSNTVYGLIKVLMAICGSVRIKDWRS